MIWKHATIGKRIATGFGIILVLLCVLCMFACTGVSGIVRNADQVIEGNKLSGLLAEKEVDHLNWVGKVNALLNDNRVTELEVETDEETSSAKEEMAAMTRQNAENSNRANTLILETSLAATQANQSMEGLNRSMGEIALAGEETSKIIKTIDEIALSGQQAQGIGQVSTAVNAMDKITQQNAANAEESASASEEMNAQAVQMKAIVDQLMILVGGVNTATAKKRHESPYPGESRTDRTDV